MSMQSALVLTSLIAAATSAQAHASPARVALTHTADVQRPVRGDSVRTLRAARRAQERFESVRRAHLPFQPGAPRGPCDVEVGRLCYWHDDGAPPRELPEPERIGRDRDQLLAVLADAARQIGGDEWIVGQRVRYLIEARRDADAVAAAAECGATPWWCASLRGLALHRAGDYAGAESAFADALAGMPAEQRCRWTDISVFLEGSAATRYRRLPCAERGSMERRFWWLARPLYGLAGNDLLTEFFARRTMSRLEQQARSAYNMSWGWDVDELLMRYGWPTWWTRDRPSTLSSMGPVIVGHEPTPSFFFHPAERLLLAVEPGDARPEDWEPRRSLPRARFAPAYAASFSDLRAQVAVFRRGDSALVVAAYESPADSLFEGAGVQATLALARDDSSAIVLARGRHPAGATEALVAVARGGPLLVSVELTAPATRGVARTRFGVRTPPPSGRIALSDLLLHEPAGTGVAGLEEIARRALGSTRLPAGGSVGLYWETYGLPPEGEPLSLTLSVERIGVPWHTRAAERLGLSARVTPLRIRWPEVPARDRSFASRTIDVDLSALPPGRYRIRLTAAAEDGSAASTERLVELTPRD